MAQAEVPGTGPEVINVGYVTLFAGRIADLLGRTLEEM